MRSFGRNSPFTTGPSGYQSLPKRQITRPKYLFIPKGVAQDNVSTTSTYPGQSVSVADDRLTGMIDAYVRENGPISERRMGPFKFVVVGSAEAAKKILQEDADSFDKGPLSVVSGFLLGKGLITADAALWQKRRRLIVPSMHQAFLKRMVEVFVASGEQALINLRKAEQKGVAVEMENLYLSYGLDIIGKAVFNYDFGSLKKTDPVVQAVYEALAETNHRAEFLLPYWSLPFADRIFPRQIKLRKSMAVINETVDRLVKYSLDILQDEGFAEDGEQLSTKDPSILRYLLNAGEAPSSQQLRDDLITLLVAGHETVAAAMTWTTYELCKHPEVVAKIQQEVDEVLGDRQATFDDILRLKYTTRVVCEGLRLYPQPSILMRGAAADVTVGGTKYPKGTLFTIATYSIQRSADNWERPDEFLPERFPLDKPPPTDFNTDCRFMPFGSGKRKCIGDNLAIAEATLGLAMILREFDIKLDPTGPPIGLKTVATMHTTEGLYVQLSKRSRGDQPKRQSAGLVAAASGA